MSWRDTDLADSFDSLYQWVETEMHRAVGWYLTEKTAKARWSRALRIATVLAATVGGGLLLVAANTDTLGAVWGHAMLVVAAGTVAMDKGFGFTTSWRRYITTEIAIQHELGELQVQWARAALQRGGRPLGIDDAAALLETLAQALTRLRDHIARETATWADEVQDAVGELRALATPNHV